MFGTIKRLVFGAGLGQVISYLLLPFLTLTYAPDQLGYFSTIYSYSYILTVFFSCRMEIPLGMSKTIEDRNLAINGLIVVFLSSVTLSVLIFFFLNYFNLLISFSKVEYMLVWILAVLLTYERVGHNILVSFSMPRNLSRVKAFTPSLTLIFQLLIPSNFMLFFSFVAVRLLINLKYFHNLYRDFDLNVMYGLSFIKEKRNFFIYSTPSGVFSGLNNTFLVIIISSFVGLKAAGLIFLVQKITTAPVSLLSPAIHQGLMIHTNFSDLNSSATFQQNINRIGFYLTFFSLIIMLALVALCFQFGEAIAPFFPLAWADLVWMLPYFVIIATVQINVMTFIIYYEFYNKQAYNLVTQLVVFLFKGAAVIIAFSDGELSKVALNTFKDITIFGYFIGTLLFFYVTRNRYIFITQCGTIFLAYIITLPLID